MPHHPHLGAILLALLLAGPAARAAAPPPPRLVVDLTPAQRRDLDASARARPPRTVPQARVRLAGSIPAWLLTHVELPPDEERRRAHALHDALTAVEPVGPAPAAAEALFAPLVAALPSHLEAHLGHWRLHALGGPPGLFTAGGARVYLRGELAESLLAAGPRGRDALAFLMAREIAHVALGHGRRGWQLLEFEEELRRGLALRVAADELRAALETGVRRAGDLVTFLYTPAQEEAADRFALQLCQAAGHDPDAALDGLRTLARLDRSAPATLDRLRWLLGELEGTVDGDDFGLFLYDRATDSLRRCPDGAVGADDRPIVFVHGLHGSATSLIAYLRHFGQRRELLGRRLLAFRYPGSGSLARAGRLLRREIDRVGAGRAGPAFVAHSAGGLVVRFYAERRGGPLGQAVFLGTPHAGSDLAALGFLLDLGQFAGGLGVGLDGAVARTATTGAGEMADDLHPGSLFLRDLGRDPRLAGRYHVVAGRRLGSPAALALEVGFRSARHHVLGHVPDHLPAPWADRARAWLKGLRVPDEVSRGDLVVSRVSARLPGAGRTTEVALNHAALCSDPDLIRTVLASLLLGP